VFGVLGVAGVLKYNRPDAAAAFLESLLQVHSIALVRTLGLAEIVLALAVVSGGASVWVGRLVIATFTAFAVAHLLASRGGSGPACGCLGSSSLADRIPPWGWVAGNATLALLGGLIATDATSMTVRAPEAHKGSKAVGHAS